MKFLADENFNNDIVRGVLRRYSTIVIVRAQDTALRSQPDELVFDYAITQEYLILTHDVNTMSQLFYARLNEGNPVPGLFLIAERQTISNIIELIILIASVSLYEEWAGRLTYLPLR